MAEIVTRIFKVAPVIFDYKIFEPMVFVDNPRICYKMKAYGICEGGHLNSSSFKDREFIKEKGNCIRIIMLGDSITKGTGVKLGETFSDQLEAMLNATSQRIGSNIQFDVMNFGVGGYNIVSEIEILKEYGIRYNPDVVILNYFYNDNELYSFNYYFFMKKPGITTAEKNLAYQYYLNSNNFRMIRFLLRSHLFTYCWSRIGALFWQYNPIDNVSIGTYKNDIISEKLIELKSMSKRYNFKVLICMHPILDYDYMPPNQNYASTQAAAKLEGLICIDLAPSYKNKSQDPKVFLLRPDDKIHINAYGHTLIAEALFKALRDNEFIKL